MANANRAYAENVPGDFENILNLVTVTKTAFFRHPDQLSTLSESLIPSLDRTLRVSEPIRI